MNAEIVFRLQWSIDEDAANDRANLHYRMLEKVADGTIDPDDIADVGGAGGAPTPDYVPTALDEIALKLTQLVEQQSALAEQIEGIQETLGTTRPGKAK